MTARRPAPPDDTELHALVDQRLPAAQADALRAALDAPARQQVAAWQRQRELLQALHRDWLERPTPDTVWHAGDRLQRRQGAQGRWMAGVGMAALWVLAFGLGWGLHGLQGGGAAQVAAAPPLQFAHQAAAAYVVYQPEQRHPVEVAADQQDHLVQWLSKRLSRPLAVPKLQAQGFDLVGGRLLPGVAPPSEPAALSPEGTDAAPGQPGIDVGVRAQLMYQNAAGQRITLYLGALDGAQPAAFRFDQQGPVSSFYWVEGGFGYALTGELPRPVLQTLATAMYEQLQRGPGRPADARTPARGS